jgi:hypothetical protein
MQSHGESSQVRLVHTSHKSSPSKLLDPPAVEEISTLTCPGSGKTGICICPRCSKHSGSRTLIARANPLREREPQLYKLLDEMSRLSLQENKRLWDELCIEINAEDYYEHLPTFVEILLEGTWRTDALNVRGWLRQSLARRVERMMPDDYAPVGHRSLRRRPGGPKFDRRNGALTAFVTRPYVEFETLNEDGETMTPEEAIAGRIERKKLQTAGGEDENIVPMPADRESLQFLGRRTYAEKWEALRCAQMVEALKNDRPTFDRELAKAVHDQRRLVKRLELDRYEAEVVAVISLLWDAGPRMYLKFLDETTKRRMRNAWDRLDRRKKNPDFRRALRCTETEEDDL